MNGELGSIVFSYRYNRSNKDSRKLYKPIFLSSGVLTSESS